MEMDALKAELETLIDKHKLYNILTAIELIAEERATRKYSLEVMREWRRCSVEIADIAHRTSIIDI